MSFGDRTTETEVTDGRSDGTAPGDGTQPGEGAAGDVRIATRPPPALEPFNLAGVLGPAEVHGARTLCELVGDNRPEVLLAAALALRAPLHGHVCVELGAVARTVTGIEDAPVGSEDLTWPDPVSWVAVLADSPLVAVRPPGTPAIAPHEDRPLSLVGDRLYLDRYWRYERRVAEVLRRRAGRSSEPVDAAELRHRLDRLLPPGDERPDRQRLAVAAGTLRDLTVIAGGPGTGKTHTVARLLALLHELAGDRHPRVAAVAPTGKAADRLTAALREAATTLETDDVVRARLRALEASTVHRLLGWDPRSRTRFRYGRDHKLPHDVVVVDETSMVDLPLMAKLVAALRPATKLVLVGDPDQLASVEAGAVLADIVGPSGDELRFSSETRAVLHEATCEPLDGVGAAREDGIDDAVTVLGAVRRYDPGSAIARLATAVHAGDPDGAIEVLAAGSAGVAWVDASPGDREGPELLPVRTSVVDAYRHVDEAARRGHPTRALDAMAALRVLCAHRHGPAGVAGWVPLIERWLTEEVAGFDPTGRWYVGRPVLVTRNEPRLRLFNGDVGITVEHDDGTHVAFRGPDGIRLVGPSRLEEVETVHAMTIHKSQGSQFERVVVVLADETSPILTRELLYTAVTRARRGVTVVGTEASIRHSISRRVSRASGLRETLWGPAAR
jgi:exodeoxyribonuclease V alpha subunit